ncbi:UNVERIFIED_CONTAM: hypothetical protein HDU68_012711 [Siphonaria sp. JEL0065]|nr:hypothetical protein HDU68_012711 [Siphonaria sp. JEL0065]
MVASEATTLLGHSSNQHQPNLRLQWTIVFSCLSLFVYALWQCQAVRGVWPPVVAAVSLAGAAFLAMVDYIEKLETGTKRWSEEKAKTWYAKQPWLVGANFLPSSASNQLEMFQKETFDLPTIDRELGYTSKIGMNTVRVFLHDLLFEQDPNGFLGRVDAFLEVSKRHGIRPLIVFFDSCWAPYPHLGRQEEPVPGVHNSRWVKSPGLAALADYTQHPRLEHYVRSVILRFKTDERILGWDLWNEPENSMSPEHLAIVTKLLPQVFRWAREEGATQPLTSGLWNGIKLDDFQLMQIDLSDIISFHNYSNGQDFESEVKKLKLFNRPLICTEWLARPHSQVGQVLPVGKRENVGMINWGLVDGRMQTKFPWDSVGNPYDHEPVPWFHELLHRDGTPYSREEYDLFKRFTSRV